MAEEGWRCGPTAAGPEYPLARCGQHRQAGSSGLWRDSVQSQHVEVRPGSRRQAYLEVCSKFTSISSCTGGLQGQTEDYNESLGNGTSLRSPQHPRLMMAPLSKANKGAPCKFFLTDQGCKGAVACKFSHDVDRKRGRDNAGHVEASSMLPRRAPRRRRTTRTTTPTALHGQARLD